MRWFIASLIPINFIDEQDDADNDVELEELDPVTLAEQGTRRGSRFSADGTPLFLRAFLESANPSLNFQYQFKERKCIALEEEVDRRVNGKKVKYFE